MKAATITRLAATALLASMATGCASGAMRSPSHGSATATAVQAVPPLPPSPESVACGVLSALETGGLTHMLASIARAGSVGKADIQALNQAGRALAHQAYLVHSAGGDEAVSDDLGYLWIALWQILPDKAAARRITFAAGQAQSAQATADTACRGYTCP